jgi:hypothetical protein
MKSISKSLLIFVCLSLILIVPLKEVYGQTTVTIGSGSAGCTYPYSTFWQCGRTQMLYSKAEITAAGGSVGTVSQIGLDVVSFDPLQMENFNIRIRNISSGTVTAWVNDSMSTCFNDNYALLGTGWQMINLQTPFHYEGGNLLVEICYTNSTSSNSSVVNGTEMLQQVLTYYMDNGTGCELISININSIRPNLRFIEQSSLGIPSLLKFDEIKVFPNPADQVLYIQSDRPMAAMEITDLTGKIMSHGSAANVFREQINTAELPEGLYFLKLSVDKDILFKKIIIRH